MGGNARPLRSWLTSRLRRLAWPDPGRPNTSEGVPHARSSQELRVVILVRGLFQKPGMLVNPITSGDRSPTGATRGRAPQEEYGAWCVVGDQAGGVSDGWWPHGRPRSANTTIRSTGSDSAAMQIMRPGLRERMSSLSQPLSHREERRRCSAVLMLVVRRQAHEAVPDGYRVRQPRLRQATTPRVEQ